MKNKILKEGLTYDDVLVVPSYSEILPHMADISTKFTKNITLNIPVVSLLWTLLQKLKWLLLLLKKEVIGVYIKI